MREIIIISRCQKIKRLNALEQIGEFHFRGAYLGHYIKKIFLKVPLSETIEVQEEYILHIQLHSVDGDCLKGKIIRSKNLEACFRKD